MADAIGCPIGTHDSAWIVKGGRAGKIISVALEQAATAPRDVRGAAQRVRVIVVTQELAFHEIAACPVDEPFAWGRTAPPEFGIQIPPIPDAELRRLPRDEARHLPIAA